MGSPFITIVDTDHKPLLGLFKNKEPNNARQTRWCLTASMLKVDIRYEQEKKNVVADALSRMKNLEEKKVLATKISNNKENDMLSKVIKEFINEKFTKKQMEQNTSLMETIIGNQSQKLTKKLKLIFETHKNQTRPVKKPTTQLHPSIMAQPRIEKEKRIEKELRDKERASTTTSVENNKKKQ